MDESFFRKIAAILILSVLLVLSFLLLKPILLSILVGFLLAFLFSPIYSKLYKLTKLKVIPALFICILLLAAIIIPIWLFTPTVINESMKLVESSQKLDIITPLRTIFPTLFSSESFSQQVASITQSFITKITNSIMNYISGIILNFPQILLQIFVILFIFFSTLIDKDRILNYIRSLLPFSKEVEKKLFDSTKDITFAVLYGYIIVGIVQGIILGSGFFIFGVQNPFLLTFLTIIVGVLPLVGPSIVGIPVAIGLLLIGSPISAFGILAFTLLSSLSEQLIRPLIVSKKAKLPNMVVLVGMIGGFLLFGILGFILGPLILAYLIIIIEVYRNKSVL